MATIEEKRLREEMQRRKEQVVCADFLKLKEEYPNEKAYTLFETLAFKYRKGETGMEGIAFPITPIGVRYIIVKNNLYTPTTKSKKPRKIHHKENI
ncbi:MAG: hypothetical protein NC548_36970 [Lachnospiraceae bacterium]|nr:hypothetical protein [Lachnospiraceae bacterium]